MIVNTLCRCAHLTSDHETLDPWTPDQQAEHGSPCNICNALPVDEKTTRDQYGMLCVGYVEWPIAEIPWPETYEARAVGCCCPVGVNVQRAKLKMQPVYAPSCVIHDWVCRRVEPCEHTDTTGLIESGVYSIQHVTPHYACEHCTVPQIVCQTCQKIWSDWRVSPKRCGWTTSVYKTQGVGPSTITSIPVKWTCSTCQTGGQS